MVDCDRIAALKVFEVILCTTCLLYKWWTDEESSRLYFLLEKRSREWPLLNNITWNQPGSWFADVTFGGYVIITIGLLMAHVIGELRHTRKTECFLLGIGAFLFFGVGCMVITSFDNVPDGLIDNAIILGVTAILTGFIFLLDIGCFKRRDRSGGKVDRQEKEFRMKRETIDRRPQSAKQTVTTAVSVTDTAKQNGLNRTEDEAQDRVISELRSSIKKKRDTGTRAVDEVDATVHRVEREMVQNRAAPRPQSGDIRRNYRHRQDGGTTTAVADERDNGYNYDQQSIRNYGKERAIVSHGDDSDDDESYESDAEAIPHYDRKSRGSQTSRKHFEKKMIVTERSTTMSSSSTSHTTLTKTSNPKKDAMVSTDSPISRFQTQSPTVSTTDPRKSDSPTSEEAYELHPPASTSVLMSNGKKFQPVITPSRIERLAENARTISRETKTTTTTSTPASPQDPGYVLHTASKWPNTTPLAPRPYAKTVHERVLSPLHSAV